MTNRDILNALGDIDESYITEANGRNKKQKGHYYKVFGYGGVPFNSSRGSICRSEDDTARQN